MATASAVTTAQTPPTAASEVEPHSFPARKDASMRGKTNSDMRRLTATTMTSGSAASAIGGPTSLGRPWIASGGSNVLAVVARSRTTRSSAALSCGTSAP